MVYLVTGASQGIGKAIALKLVADGETVMGTHTGRVPAPSDIAGIEWVKLDLLNETSLSEFLQLIKGVENLQGLVNNAGVNEIQTIERLSRDSLERVLSVNLVGPIEIAAAAGACMKSLGKGNIVNIASIWATSGRAGRLAYAASKGGLVAATRVLSQELAPFGVSVNAVSPGFTATDLTTRTAGTNVLSFISQSVPLGRLLKTEEVAEAVVMLLNQVSPAITGHDLVVDGGFLAGRTLS